MAAIKYMAKVEAQVVRKRKTTVVETTLAELVKQNGNVTPQMIVTEAEQPNHPLHEYFEWDDSEAARKFRLSQALAMILATKYVCFLKENHRAKKTAGAIDSSKNAAQVRRLLPSFTGEGFRDRSDVLRDKGARRAVVEKKLSVLRSWCQSVIDIDELSNIREGVLTLIG